MLSCRTRHQHTIALETNKNKEERNHFDHGVILSVSGYKVLSLLDMPSSDAGSIDQADVYVHITFIKKWDICAGAALLNALGNVTTFIFTLLFPFQFQILFRCSYWLNNLTKPSFGRHTFVIGLHFSTLALKAPEILVSNPFSITLDIHD